VYNDRVEHDVSFDCPSHGWAPDAHADAYKFRTRSGCIALPHVDCPVRFGPAESAKLIVSSRHAFPATVFSLVDLWQYIVYCACQRFICVSGRTISYHDVAGLFLFFFVCEFASRGTHFQTSLHPRPMIGDRTALMQQCITRDNDSRILLRAVAPTYQTPVAP
jgi:hypothetical protein